MTSLRDKVVLITGSGDVTGIGYATALHMCQFQPRLVITGRDQDKLNDVARRLTENGLAQDRILPVVCDLTKEDELNTLVQTTIDSNGLLDVLVNNAAVTSYTSTLEATMEEFDHVMATNVRSPFLLTKLCLPHLIKTKGCVVNVSSISGPMAYSGEVAYGMSKASLDQFTRILANEVAEYGVRVNSVNPGVVRTNIQVKGGMSEERYAQYAERQKSTHQLGRMGEPDEVAKAITFLASDQASFTTGQLLFVDGGRHIHYV
ncbi:3-oxoacyl-[acyl-carrier-protein] reductase FabG-like isoform X6 [Dreissena polymorpha]|uniref:3-oxoacyl-[acyl-carrier-protein] reductase FabG-like isoform X2 n=1 Tax=Dreissena polymorpha TaxID=45954 RepID=UPI0022649779|nr:3-oxoacyl-[acyl-carrier-protein] reductase FabG-like isoform X2 [Dreissena polymorpha]XP_052220924.1 3-oxoacyl-[acyl-carrier-protein] reductase FabG-like isoform X5 [Dreissena polymorpha]XP_052220925.1 3-oxoacyl-[acyl-carrier-protein] reductase FabG-like isoform X6 [Dreissena polymorpha]